ncbi:tetratricopeptide repeat protein [Neorickettsia sp. 179522]|uniref:tetratricopeptide repeat protein n=1 Tax=Neorickettsia sp. 179522 TaxID=1714371 RepID=UPI00060B1586|nr:tetratricopeptide repeat protein [Neorickettsia sp. 179522]
MSAYGCMRFVLFWFLLLLPLYTPFFCGSVALAIQQVSEPHVDLSSVVRELETIRSSISKIEIILGELKKEGKIPKKPVPYPTKKPQDTRKVSIKENEPELSSLDNIDKTTLYDVNKIKNMDPHDAAERNHYKNILLLMERSQSEEAEKSLNQFVGRFPKSNFLDDVYYFLGNLHLNKKQHKAALVSFIKSYHADKTGIRAPLALVKSISILRSTGDYDHACSILRKALKEFSSNSTVKTQLQKEKEILSARCENVMQEFE